MLFSSLLKFIVCGLLMLFALPARAEDEFERPPISYRTTTPKNDISDLQIRIDQGEQSLAHHQEQGYLLALLQALEIPVESQVLVFSKTSLQARRISPRTPRAIYFNDEIYVGYTQGGDKLEIAAMDAGLGTAFYTLHQTDIEKPHFLKETDDCLTCHASSRTDHIPGLLSRSLFVNAAGFPVFSRGSHNVDHTTPIVDRWGGWYVTGSHGTQVHQGNLIVRNEDIPAEVENTTGLNVLDLQDRFNIQQYPTPHSDIVAHLVLEHQLLMHNRMIRANFTTRQALDYEATMNRALEEPEGQRRESTTRRIQHAGDALIEALLLVKEAELAGPIVGTSSYAEQFSQRGPRDSQGRSLRDFDLTRRLFKYPCSFLIYSRSFDLLPDEMKNYVWQELWEILAKNKKPELFAHLSVEDRRAIIEILRETKPGLPACWKE